MLTFGILLAGVLSYGFVVNVNHGWQYVQAFPALVSAVMLGELASVYCHCRVYECMNDVHICLISF